jgi:hypothetical protein
MTIRFLLLCVLLPALVLLLLGCAKAPEGDRDDAAVPDLAWFEDVTAEVGLDFIHDAGPTGKFFMPQIMGSGAALFDFDGDGRLDLYLIHQGGPRGKKNQLFRQLPDGTFKDVSKGSGLDVAGFGTGVAIGDVNNDGWPDVLLTEYGRIRLFRNNGNGTFTDITREAGLDNPLWATSAAFVDYDNDGRLDLVVVNYIAYDPTWPCPGKNGKLDFCNPASFPGTSSRLFRNISPREGVDKGKVRFQDVSVESGIARKTGPGLGVMCADFNGDGWPDIFIANDGAPNHLWINQKNGTFKEEARRRGVAINAMGKAEGNMGIAYADVDGDGLEDLFVTHLANETNTVWKQGPAGLFLDWTAVSGMHRPMKRGTGFGTVLADFDHDGAVDAIVVNGAVARAYPARPGSSVGAFWSQYAEKNEVFANDGKGRFKDVSALNPDLCGHDTVARGLAVGDVRNSGALWLLVTEVAGRARLYRNRAADRGHWLVARVMDPALKRDIPAARVVVRSGQRKWIRTSPSGGSYLCSHDPRVHFGLGKATSIDEISVRWPDGKVEIFAGGAVDCFRTLARGQGRIEQREPAGK